MSKLFQLNCGVQSYDWGKIGKSSAVAQFADSSIAIDDSKPYAELWMGTHPSVPSKNKQTGETLRQIISANNNQYLGKDVVAKFGGQDGSVPFLLKVLSIGKALSIQAHPDKQLAAILHKTDPKNYPDDNHKPEMAIAVTEFEAFCGFRPLEQIREFLTTIPELIELVGKDEAEKFKHAVIGHEHVPIGSDQDKANRRALQSLFGKLMNRDQDSILAAAKSLVSRALEESMTFGGSAGGKELAELIVRLNKQFPNDIGLFCGALLLNYVRMNPGEAMFLKAKDPHAYISGDIIECMAASDNVVRAGFTPKFKDVKNLVEMLTYNYAPVIEQKMAPLRFDRASGDNCKFTLYDPPIDEFAVLESKLPQGSKAKIKPINGPSIVVSTNGKGTIAVDSDKFEYNTGSVFFIAPGSTVELTSTNGDFITYRAFVEV